jgi:acid phosphatase type 7
MKTYRRLLGVLGILIVVGTAAIAATSAKPAFEKGPYLQSATSDGVTVMWQAAKSGHATVDYGATPALGSTVALVQTTDPVCARISGLAPGTTYYYRVTEGSAQSPVCSFRTFPLAGRFTFAAYGDSRSNPAEHAKVAAGIASRNPDFVIHTGDFVFNGRLGGSWDSQFFIPAQAYMASSAVFAAIGNHEAESSFFYKYLGGHDGKPWYSFDCANAHFTFLDSCKGISPGGEQYNWLVTDLASTSKTWKVVVFHHAMYSSGPHGINQNERKVLEPVFVKYGVDVAFTGHDHEYERTVPLGLPGSANKVVYIVTGGGGAPTHQPKGAAFTVVKSALHHYCLITVDGGTLHLEAYDTGGVKLDDWITTKSDAPVGPTVTASAK